MYTSFYILLSEARLICSNPYTAYGVDHTSFLILKVWRSRLRTLLPPTKIDNASRIRLAHSPFMPLRLREIGLGLDSLLMVQSILDSCRGPL